MTHCNFYIDGTWCEPQEPATPHPVINPATEQSVGTVAMGGAADADRAVMAARRAFDAYSQTSLAYRTDMLHKLQGIFERRYTEMAQAISTEMGAPWDLAYDSQAECGPGHIKATLEAARDYPFEVKSGQGDLLCEAIGVSVLITPWNWPMNQVVAKLAPALLAGCTVVLKPSEFAPLSAKLVGEYMAADLGHAALIAVLTVAGTAPAEAGGASPAMAVTSACTWAASSRLPSLASITSICLSAD